MDENGKRILELQKIDSELVEIERQLAAYPKRLRALETEAAQAHERLKTASERLKGARAQRKLVETEIAQTQETIRKYLNQQMQVKTNKEYQAITHQIETVKTAVSEQETAALEAMELEDSLEAQIAELNDVVRHADRENQTESARIAILENEKRQRAKDLKRERALCLQQLPEDLAEKYQTLFARFPGMAVVPADGQTCGGCHMNLLPSTLQQISESGTLVPCSHCRRLLYCKEG